MKPHRIRMTHNLLLNYGLYRQMHIYVRTPFPRSAHDRGHHEPPLLGP